MLLSTKGLPLGYGHAPIYTLGWRDNVVTRSFMPPLGKHQKHYAGHYTITSYFKISSPFIFISCGKSLKYSKKRCWTFLLLFSFIRRRFNYLLWCIRIIFIINSLFCLILLAPLLEKNNLNDNFPDEIKNHTVDKSGQKNQTKKFSYLKCVSLSILLLHMLFYRKFIT